MARLTTEQLQHAIAACGDVMETAPQHVQELRASLGENINAIRCEGRGLALDAARTLGRMVEYYQARDGELEILAAVVDHGLKAFPLDEMLASLEQYWESIVEWIRGLGPNPVPRMIHGPHNIAIQAHAELPTRGDA